MAWEPLPHEADLFCNVYIDESSQTKHRYLVIGGLVVPLGFADAFEEHIISARDDTIAPKAADGRPRVIKWQKVNDYNVASYRKVVDAFFASERDLKVPVIKHIDINCVVVDTSKKDLKVTGEGDIEIGFNKEVYFLCVPLIGKRFPKELFHLYPDRRKSPYPLRQAQDIMNFGAKKYGDKRDWPYRRLQYREPEDCQALQVVDIFIGALAYRLNGHCDKPDANAAKKDLSAYILKRAKITDPTKATSYFRRRFSLVHRDGSPRKKKR